MSSSSPYKRTRRAMMFFFMYLVAFFFLWQKSSRYTLQKTFFDNQNTNTQTKALRFFLSLSPPLSLSELLLFFRRRFLLFVFVSSFSFRKKKKRKKKIKRVGDVTFVGPYKHELKNMMSSCAPRTASSSSSSSSVVLLFRHRKPSSSSFCSDGSGGGGGIERQKGTLANRTLLTRRRPTEFVRCNTTVGNANATTTTTTTTTLRNRHHHHHHHHHHHRHDGKTNVVVGRRRGGKESFVATRARVVDSENVDGDERLKTPALPLVEVIEKSNDGTRILQCMLRARVTEKSGNIRCVVLPLDVPIDVLRGEANSEDEDLSDIDDKELNEILPDMQLALAKKGLLLQRSALCFTVRGPVRADYDDCLELDQGRDEAPQEATELVTFDSDATGFRYLVYAPLNPVLIVTKEVGGDSSRHEAVTEEPDEIVEAAIERVYEELAAGPDDELFLEMERSMNDSNKKGNTTTNSGRGGGKKKKK